MFKTDLQKKIAIWAGLIFLLTCILLIAFKVTTIYILIAAFFLLPLIFVADVCFVTLPLTIPAFFILAGYTLVKKNYEKFCNIYEYLSIMVVVGIVNSEIDNILNMKNYITQTNCLRLYWIAYFGVFLVCESLFFARKKDTRLFISIHGVMLVFYLIYKLIESFE